MRGISTPIYERKEPLRVLIDKTIGNRLAPGKIIKILSGN